MVAASLMNAAYDGHYKCVKLLIEAGADANLQDEDGNTALMDAARGALIEESYRHQSKCVKILLAQGAEVGCFVVPSSFKLRFKYIQQFKRLMMLLFSSGLDLLRVDEEYKRSSSRDRTESEEHL